MNRILATIVAAASLGAGTASAWDRPADEASLVVASVIESVENAPRVAAAQGGWPRSAFAGGSVRATAVDHRNLVVRYTVEVDAWDRDACFGALSAAIKEVGGDVPSTAESVRVSGQAYTVESLRPTTRYVAGYFPNEPINKYGRDETHYPVLDACRDTAMPMKIVVRRASGGVPSGGFASVAR